MAQPGPPANPAELLSSQALQGTPAGLEVVFVLYVPWFGLCRGGQNRQGGREQQQAELWTAKTATHQPYSTHIDCFCSWEVLESTESADGCYSDASKQAFRRIYCSNV